MSIVNFTIPHTLNRRVAQIMKKKGFASKAEFFRFAAVYFMDIVDKPFADEEDRLHYLAAAVSREVAAQYGNKKLPSVREQLADV